jgi:hypothetical protein
MFNVLLEIRHWISFGNYKIVKLEIFILKVRDLSFISPMYIGGDGWRICSFTKSLGKCGGIIIKIIILPRYFLSLKMA